MPAPDARTTLTIAGLVTAFTGIFWAYEGWYQLPFNAAKTLQGIDVEEVPAVLRPAT